MGGASCRVRTPSNLGACSNDVHTFLVSVEEGWLDPLRWKGQLAVSAGAYGNCQGSDRAVLSGIMQIVTSAVRDFCTCNVFSRVA